MAKNMSIPDSESQFKERAVKFLLDQLSGTAEGKALVDFARAHGVEISLEPKRGGEWIAVENRVRIAQEVTREEALGILVHELRHAWQSYSIPALIAISHDESLALAEHIVLVRATEADAFSYQLCMLTEMKKQKNITSVAGAMVGKNSPLSESLQKEITSFARDFARKYKDNSFSPDARREAFEFFQSSQFFKSLYDGPYYDWFIKYKCGNKKLQLRSVCAIFNKLSQNRIGGQSKYLSARAIRSIGGDTLARLDPLLRGLVAK